MKTTLFGVLTLALTCASGVAVADDATNTAYHPDISGSYNKFRIGFGADLGFPSAASVGLVIHPKVDWLVLQPSITYNGLAFGGRFSLKLDPFGLVPRLPIGLFADFQAGFAGQGDLPGHSNFPSLGYDYLNFYGGLRLGRPNGFNWVIELGPSYLHFNTSNFQSAINNAGSNIIIANPVVNGWVSPSFITGFQVVFP